MVTGNKSLFLTYQVLPDIITKFCAALGNGVNLNSQKKVSSLV